MVAIQISWAVVVCGTGGLFLGGRFQLEADLEGDLPVVNLALFDAAAGFDDLKPAHVFDGLMGEIDGLVHGILDARGRSSGELNTFVDGIFHDDGADGLFFAAGTLECLLDSFLNRLSGFAGAFLDAAQHFFLPACDVLEIVVGELAPLLFQFAHGDVPVALDFEYVHNWRLIRAACVTADVLPPWG